MHRSIATALLRRFLSALGALGLACASFHPLVAQVPQLINYQGRLAVGGVNFDGAGKFKFALVNTDGTATYWSNDGTSNAGSEPTAAVTLTVTKGLYSVLLGDATLLHMTGLPATVFTNADVRLRVWFDDGTNGSQLLTPDQRIAAVGYAMTAATAQTVADGAITAAKIAPGAVGSTQLASNLTLSGTTTGSFVGDGSALTSVPAVNLQQVALLKWSPRTVASTFGTAPNPEAVCFDGTSIWVVCYNNATSTVTKMNPSTGATVGTYNVGPGAIAICYDGTNIWVANSTGNSVTKLNPGTGATIGTYFVGSAPYGICFDGTSIWVANSGNNTVTKLDPATGTTVGTYPVGTTPNAVCFDGTSVWVASQNHSVTKLNPTTGSAIGTYDVLTNPNSICFDGASIWVRTVGISSNLIKLNASTGATIGTYTVGTLQGGICFDGSSIWVSSGTTSISKVNIGTGATTGTYTTGMSPGGVCFDGANIWVTSGHDGTVSKL